MNQGNQEERVRAGCQVTYFGCSRFNLIGPGFENFLQINGHDPEGCCDAIVIPGGYLLLDTNELARRRIRQELQTSISLHQPEDVVLADCWECHSKADSQLDRDRKSHRAENYLHEWFPQVRIMRYQSARHEGPLPNNCALVACLDWRNWPVIRNFAAEARYAIVTLAGDFERAADKSTPDDQDELLAQLKQVINPLSEGRILLIGHLGCGWRSRTRGFTNDTSESLQRAILLESGMTVIQRLKPFFPKHRLELAVSLTRGHSPSQGLDFLAQD